MRNEITQKLDSSMSQIRTQLGIRSGTTGHKKGCPIFKAVIRKLFEPRHTKLKLKNTRLTRQVSFIFFAPNFEFLVINELNL